MNEKQLAQGIAAADQVGSAIRETVAKLVASYYLGLVDAGVPKDQACVLAAQFQAPMVQAIMAKVTERMA